MHAIDDIVFETSHHSTKIGRRFDHIVIEIPANFCDMMTRLENDVIDRVHMCIASVHTYICTRSAASFAVRDIMSHNPSHR